MNTQTFQVFQLRGMDERWLADGSDALYIQDMTWVDNDAWQTCGGWYPYFQQSPYYGADDVAVGHGAVRSLHWFAQHNGARQFLVYEQQTFDNKKNKVDEEHLELRYFDGSRNAKGYSLVQDNEASRIMVQFERKRERTNANADIGEGLKAIADRTDAKLAIPTQTQAWGNRLYIVNGHQAPMVFNGEYAEKAGFENPPSPPSAQSADFMDTATFCMAIGDNNPKIKKGMYGLFDDFTYWGMGPKSYAKYGVGKYKEAVFSLHGPAAGNPDAFSGAEWVAPGPLAMERTMVGAPYWSLYDQEKKIKTSLKVNQQLDRRRVGWQYKVTYVNERGQESEASNASNVAMFMNGTGKWNQHGKCFITVHLPRGPAECVARRIYRTRNLYNSKGSMVSKGRSTRFYFLKEIQDNMTEVFVDGHPDTSLGSLLATRQLGSYPPGTRYLASFKNTMFTAGGSQNNVHFSAPNFPEVFPDRNVLHVGDADGGPITGMWATRNALVIFKSRGIYLIKSDSRGRFVAQTLNKDIGCWAPNSIGEVPGLGLVFLSERHVCLLEGALENTGTITGVVKLSTEIPNQMELINTSAAIRAAGVVYLKDNEYWLSVPTHGSRVNNLLLVYHYKVGAWSVRKDVPVGCAVTSRDHRGYLFFGTEPGGAAAVALPEYLGALATTALTEGETGSSEEGVSTSTPSMRRWQDYSGVALYSKGYRKKGNEWDVNPIYKTVNLPFGSVYKTTLPAHLFVYAVGYGNNNLSINYRVNRSLFDIRDLRQPADQQDPNERYPVYGAAKWDDDYWAEYRPTVIRYDISAAHKGPVREAGFTFATDEGSPSGTKIQIVSYDIEAKVGEQRNIKPLNEALKPDRR